MPDTSSIDISVELNLEPTSRVSLTATVANKLAELILDNRLGTGERLPSERDLAFRLEVSRIVVREALKVLAERGLVHIRPGVGTFVVHMAQGAVTGPLSRYIQRNQVAMRHLLELRTILEPAVAAAAAKAVTAEVREALARNLERTEEVVTRLEEDEDVVEAFAWADVEFHQLLATATDNPLYLLVLEPLLDRQLEVRRKGARLPGATRKAYQGHRVVFEQVVRGNAPEAARAMAEHLGAVATWLEATSEGTEGCEAREEP